MEDTRDPYERLAEAIVVTAAKDYREAARKLKRKRNNKAALKEVKEIEGFFRSDWFRQLSALDGEYILEKLRKECGL